MPWELDDDTLKRLKTREGEDNRRAVRWIMRTAKPFLPGIVVLMVYSVVNSLAGIAFALVSQEVVNSAVAQDVSSLTLFACALTAVMLAQILLRALSGYQTEKVSAQVENGYRSRLFDHILDRDYQQLSAYHSGDLMNRMTDDVNIIVSGTTTFLPSVAEIVANLVGAGSVLLLTDWSFLLVYVLATIALIVVNRVFRRAVKRLSAVVREKDGTVRSFFQDAIGSLLVLRVFVTEDSAKRQSGELLGDFYDSRLQRALVRIKSNSAMGLSMNFGHLFALVWCSFQLVWGNLSYGSLVAIMQLTGQIRQPFISASNLSSQYYSMIASAERLMEIEALAPETTPEQRALVPAGFDARRLYPSFRRIEARGLSFRYASAHDGDSTLHDVSFTVEKGQFVAIMGQSGCGKSTLFKLILGMFSPQSGTLSAQGANAAGALPAEWMQAMEALTEAKSWADEAAADAPDGGAEPEAMRTGGAWRLPLSPFTRRLFAYVPQGNLLVSGRLRDNIAFAAPSATDEEVWEACRIACADTFVRQLPDGLDTVVGEHGSGLSEGQTQRIAVARAYLSGAPILLLDEATSALDEQTEARLLANLRELNDRTCLIVTHRKAALAICDKTLMVAEGTL